MERGVGKKEEQIVKPSMYAHMCHICGGIGSFDDKTLNGIAGIAKGREEKKKKVGMILR